MKDILKLSPYYSEKVWGWEKWILSCHPEGNSIVQNGIYSGEKLSEVLNCNSEFPILIKIINAQETLSVQVHPGDDYAQLHENSKGKTECWYILEAEDGATIISGIMQGLDRKSLEQYIESGELEGHLERTPVKKGDFIYIPDGTVHAIGGGIKLLEVQQNSNITYRLYDWGRGRELHLAKSLDVIDFEGKNHGGLVPNFTKLETPFFTVELIEVESAYSTKTVNSFHSYTVIDGQGVVSWDNEELKLEIEDAIYIPQGINYTIEGNLSLMKAIV